MTWVICLAWRGLNSFSWKGGCGMTMPLLSKPCNEVTCKSLSWKLRVYKVDSMLVHALVTKLFQVSHALWTGKVLEKVITYLTILFTTWLIKNFHINWTSIDFLLIHVQYDRILECHCSAEKQSTRMLGEDNTQVDFTSVIKVSACLMCNFLYHTHVEVWTDGRKEESDYWLLQGILS